MDLITYAALLGLIESIPKGEDGDSIVGVDLSVDENGNLLYKIELG